MVVQVVVCDAYMFASICISLIARDIDGRLIGDVYQRYWGRFWECVTDVVVGQFGEDESSAYNLFEGSTCGDVFGLASAEVDFMSFLG